MKNKRLSKYLDQKGKEQSSPITKKEEVRNHSDSKIDQDFPGYPGGQSTEANIKPSTSTQKKTAAVGVKDGEKKLKSKKADDTDEQESDGSGGAFGGTEDVKE